MKDTAFIGFLAALLLVAASSIDYLGAAPDQARVAASIISLGSVVFYCAGVLRP